MTTLFLPSSFPISKNTHTIVATASAYPTLFRKSFFRSVIWISTPASLLSRLPLSTAPDLQTSCTFVHKHENIWNRNIPQHHSCIHMQYIPIDTVSLSHPCNIKRPEPKQKTQPKPILPINIKPQSEIRPLCPDEYFPFSNFHIDPFPISNYGDRNSIINDFSSCQSSKTSTNTKPVPYSKGESQKKQVILDLTSQSKQESVP